jgi:hypothetical protein
MNKFELHLYYKSETSKTFKPIEADAYFKKLFQNQADCDIVLDADEIDSRIIDMLPAKPFGRHYTISFVDPDYHKWLEEKLMELLK